LAENREQLSLSIALVASAAPAPTVKNEPARAKRERAAPEPQLELPLREPRVIGVIAGGGGGSGHRLGRLVAIDGGAPRGKPQQPLPTRDEITGALLGALADLVAGRISAVAASAIREAAEDALRQLEASERDPHRVPQFVRAARALQELLPGAR
jgi:hypothetical protein